MSRKCEICGKGVGFGHKVSHSNIKTKRRWLPNIHRVKTEVNGEIKRIYVCSKCLKAGKVRRAI